MVSMRRCVFLTVIFPFCPLSAGRAAAQAVELDIPMPQEAPSKEQVTANPASPRPGAAPGQGKRWRQLRRELLRERAEERREQRQASPEKRETEPDLAPAPKKERREQLQASSEERETEADVAPAPKKKQAEASPPDKEAPAAKPMPKAKLEPIHYHSEQRRRKWRVPRPFRKP